MEYFHASIFGNGSSKTILIGKHGSVHHQWSAITAIDGLLCHTRWGSTATNGTDIPSFHIAGKESVCQEVIIIVNIVCRFGIDRLHPLPCYLKAGVIALACLTVEHLADCIQIRQIGTVFFEPSKQVGPYTRQVADTKFQ